MAKKKNKSSDEPKIPIYKPKMDKAPEKIDADGLKTFVPERINKVMSNGVVHTELDREIVIKRVAKDLYSSPASAIRELLANEFTAARAAKTKGMNPEINIYYEKDNRRLTIEGVNTVGISQDVFTDALRWLGRSANFDGTASGQFGFGFYSYLMISDSILVKTYPIDEQPYTFYSQEALQFEFLPPPKMDTNGTQTIMVLRENIDEAKIKEKIIECSKYQPIPIYVYGFDNPPDGCAISMVEPLEELVTDIKHNMKKGDDDFLYTIELDTPDFYLCFCWDTAHRYYTGRRSMDIHLVGMPIGTEYISSIGSKHSFVNIKDERKYKPTADRDRVTDESISKLINVIDNTIMRELISRYDYEDGTKPNKYQLFTMRIMNELYRNSDELDETLRGHPVVQKVHEYSDMLVLFNIDERRWRGDYKFFDIGVDIDYQNDKKYYINPAVFDEIGVKIPCVIKESDIIDKVVKKLCRKDLTNGVFGCPDEFFDFCLKIGLNDGTKIMQEFKIVDEQTGFTVHEPNGNGKDYTYRKSLGLIDNKDSILFLKTDGITKILAINRIYADHPFKLVTVPSKRAMLDFEKAVWVRDFISSCSEQVYMTSEGPFKGEDLLKMKNLILLGLPWLNEKLAEAFSKAKFGKDKDGKHVLVILDKDDTIRLYFYLVINGDGKQIPLISTGKDLFTKRTKSPDSAMDYHYTYQTYGLYRHHILDSACLSYIKLLSENAVITKEFADSLLALYTRYPMYEIIKQLLIDKGYMTEKEFTK